MNEPVRNPDKLLNQGQKTNKELKEMQHFAKKPLKSFYILRYGFASHSVMMAARMAAVVMSIGFTPLIFWKFQSSNGIPLRFWFLYTRYKRPKCKLQRFPYFGLLLLLREIVRLYQYRQQVSLC